MNDEITAEIQKLIALENELNSIKKVKDRKLNIFDAVGMATQEIKHSAFLAWLLNPKNPHGLNNEFLCAFLQALSNYKAENWKPNAEIMRGDKFFELTEDKDIKIITEQSLSIEDGGRIDIFIEAPNKKMLLVIENKVFTSTHDEQLKRYEKEFENRFDWKKLFVYLTPNGDLPFENGVPRGNWCVFSYREIIKILQNIKVIDKKVKYLTGDYINMVDTNVLKNNKEIAALCKKIRREHKEALEILWNYNDNTENIIKYCLEYLSKNIPGFYLVKSTPLSFTFYTEQLKAFFERRGESLVNANGGLKCSGGVSCPDGPVNAGWGTGKMREESWSAAQLILMNKFSPQKAHTNMYYTFAGAFSVKLLSADQREVPMSDIEEELNAKLNAFAKTINGFNLEIETL